MKGEGFQQAEEPANPYFAVHRSLATFTPTTSCPQRIHSRRSTKRILQLGRSLGHPQSRISSSDLTSLCFTCTNVLHDAGATVGKIGTGSAAAPWCSPPLTRKKPSSSMKRKMVLTN